MIEFKNAGFQYPNKNSIGPINLTLKEGEIHLLTGRSGSGKTSITKMANGIIDNLFEGKKYGKVSIRDKNIANLSVRELISRISSVYQNPKTQFFTDNTTSELLFPLENLGYKVDDMEAMLNKLSSFFGIDSLLNRNVLELSGGEKQMICLVGALITNPDFVVLDEPTSNLDLSSIIKVRDMIAKLKSLKKTVLISEHRLNFLKDLVDRVTIVQGGQVYKTYTGEDFYQLSETERKSLGLRSLSTIETKKSSSELKENESNQCLEIESLRYKNKKKEVLNIENVNLYSGRVYFLIGKNGAGKSTFAKSLVGLIKPQRGKIKWRETKTTNKKRLKNSYLVFQDVNSQLFTSSIREEIELNNHFDRTDKLLSDLGLLNKKNAHPQSLSGGEKQRVSLAAGIASGRKIFIADEPTSGMDYANMMNVCKLLRDYACNDNIVLVISHDMEFISELADEIIFMSQGKIIRNQTRNKNFINDVISFLR